MKKYLIILSLIATLAFACVASANQSYFIPSFYLSGSSATTTVTSLAVSQTKDLVIDSFSVGENTKFDEGYLFTQLNASTTSSTTPLGVKVGITVSYSVNGIDYYVDNTATTTTANPIIMGGNPQYTLAANVAGMGSTTQRAAIKISTPARYLKITYTNITTTATSSVWAQFIGIKETAR